MIIREDSLCEHETEVAEGMRREVILCKRGDERAPSSGGLVWGLVEYLEGVEGEVAFGVEIDEVVRDEWEGLVARFDDVAMELETPLEVSRVGLSEKEVADLLGVEFCSRVL